MDISQNYNNINIEKEKKVLVEISNLTKVYRPSETVFVNALNGIDLNIYKGEFLAITGHSGSGKSTLLNLIGLIDNPTTGTIIANNENIHEFDQEKRDIFRLKFVSFVFQFFNLLENYTALENIIFQLRLQENSPKEAEKKAYEMLEFLDLTKRASLFPRELSGGEQQRVAIGRALAKDSQIILADEPTAHLDSKNAQATIDLLKQISVKFNRTVIIVTHELDQAKQADRHIVLKDGKIINTL